MPIRILGISSNSRVTVFLTLRRTCVRQGYMLPVVSKEKTTSTLVDMVAPRWWISRDGPGEVYIPDRRISTGVGEEKAVRTGGQVRAGSSMPRDPSPGPSQRAVPACRQVALHSPLPPHSPLNKCQ